MPSVSFIDTTLRPFAFELLAAFLLAAQGAKGMTMQCDISVSCRTTSFQKYRYCSVLDRGNVHFSIWSFMIRHVPSSDAA